MFIFIAFKVYFKAYVYIFERVKILKVSKVVFKSKPAEYSWNSNNIYLFRDAGSKVVILENLKLKIKVILFAGVFNFIHIKFS